MSGTLFDIERVEVVKAAQGTLFGEGSQGGTIRYLYKQPDTTGFDAAVNLSYSDMGASEDNSRRLDGMVNIPFGDGFGLRLTGWETETAGYDRRTRGFRRASRSESPIRRRAPARGWLSVVEVDFDWANFQSMTSFTDRQTPSVVVVGYTAGDLVDTEVIEGAVAVYGESRRRRIDLRAQQ